MLCNICQSTAKLVLSKLEGFKANHFFEVYECQKCKASFCYPNKEDPEIYKDIYKYGETISGYNRYHAYFRSIKNKNNPLEFLSQQEDCYWFINEYLKNNIDKHKAKLLEVGSGLGYLTYSLHNAGYNIQGVELSSDAVEGAINQFGNLYQCKNALKLGGENNFDVILLTEVIEHLSNPEAFIKQLSNILSPNGVILVTTPNKEFISNKASEWASDLPPVHLWWFTKKSFQTIAMKTNMKVEFQNFHKWNRKNFSASLYRKPKRALYLPRMNEDGSPANPNRCEIKPKKITKIIKSIIRYWFYHKKVNLAEGAIIGAIFRKTK